jgi:type II restriction enzyme
MNVVCRLGKTEFSNDDVYQFEHALARLHPDNRNVKPKIRQQLQVLRDAGFLVHAGPSEWHLK